jgi:G patch domain/KOW motif-containing protein
MNGDESNDRITNSSEKQKESNDYKKISVSLSIGKKKKKSLEPSVSAGDTANDTSRNLQNKKIAELFGSGEDENALSVAAAAQIETEKREKEGIKLVIPLSESRDKNEPLLSGLKRIVSGQDSQKDNIEQDISVQNVDASEQEAEAALIASASNHLHQQTRNADDGTNFSAFGSSLIIPKKANETDKSHPKHNGLLNDDDIKYKRDLEHRAEDIGVDSESYVAVPISEFGAAMLRGMGWTGEDENKKKTTESIVPRPHRLGLGATKLPSSLSDAVNGSQHHGTVTSKRHYARKGGSMVDRAHLEKKEEEERKWKLLQEEKQKKDLQVTLQMGSIVKVRKEDGRVGRSRAKLVKVSGVPGLNRVLVRFEFDREDTSVKKSDLVLVDRHELEETPFQSESGSLDKRTLKDMENSHSKEKKEKSSSKRSRSRSRSFDRESDKRHKDRKRKKHTDKKDRHLEEERKDHKYVVKKKYEDDSRSDQSWLIPNIRVRIISKKIGGGKFFKEKGVVIDVLKKGSEAIVQLDNGQVIDRVPERYLETAIPKVGGNAIILIGRNRHEKGKLLERNSEKGRGSIQLYEEMNIVTLSLDDMAEWCGPLDDTVNDDF